MKTLLILTLLIIAACENPSEEKSNKEGGLIRNSNPNLILIKNASATFEEFYQGFLSGNFKTGVKINETNYYVSYSPMKITLNEKYKGISDSIIIPESGKTRAYYSGFTNFVSKNNSSTKLLIVASPKKSTSIGNLIEYEMNQSVSKELISKKHQVSTALYFPNTNDEELVYYSYGIDSVPTTAGYYKYNIASRESTLLLNYLAPEAIRESIHGFDIHPSGKKLLLPISYKFYQEENAFKQPQMVEYNMETKLLDTLDISFEHDFFLWLRYNPTNPNQILALNYPWRMYQFYPYHYTQLYLVDKLAKTKRLLDDQPYRDFLSMTSCPVWSDDGRDIVFGSGLILSDHGTAALGSFSFYTLKGVN